MLKSKIYSLSMHLHKHQLYYLEQHSESFKIWSAIIRINTEGKSLIMKLGLGLLVVFTEIAISENHDLRSTLTIGLPLKSMLFWL